MRFPRLSHLFHRRTKSDTAIVIPPKKSTAPKRRSLSSLFLNDSTFGEGFTTGSSLVSEVLASVPISPFPLTAPPVLPADTTSQAFSSVSRTSTGAFFLDSPCVHHEQRILELGHALQEKITECKRLSALEMELHSEKVALQEARESNNLLSADIAELQADVMRARKELFDALNRQIPEAKETHRIKELERENNRLRKFIEVVISLGGHKPVLQQAFDSSLHGRDPEEAIVDAITDAILVPGSTWKRLLGPAIGQRVQVDYVAQLNCTLRARKDATEWRKKTKYWKRKARENDLHINTVTPSVSQLSDIVVELSPERQKAFDALVEKLRHGKLLIQGVSDDDEMSEDIEVLEVKAVFPPPGAFPLPPIAEIDHETGSTRHPYLAYSTLGIGRGSNTTLRRASTMSSILPYSNLAPLASVTFRETHAIKASHSRHRRDSFASLLDVTPSVSISSQVSARSTQRRNSLLGLVRNSQSNLANIIHGSFKAALPKEMVVAAVPSCDRVDASALLDDSISEDYQVLGYHPLLASSGSGSCPSSTSRTPRASELISVGSKVSHLQDGLPPETPTVRNFASISSTPVELLSSFSTSQELQRSPSASPGVKKSRLPVLRMSPLKHTIRRLSISRPVLVETTNAAATIAPSTERVTKRRTKITSGSENETPKGRVRAGKVGGPSPTKRGPPMRFGFGSASGTKNSKRI
ncbi:hypothetical protein NLI96_g306 [Meripilus lineatus]|uniref:Uncharacterized protein n=1 Tax=Meripilus lineatus TaxID=2056292 RepID=A0AAD5VEM7_9APHY|nr:hypothetical protein NLI96_g306 [Physisporinus lineatus]